MAENDDSRNGFITARRSIALSFNVMKGRLSYYFCRFHPTITMRKSNPKRFFVTYQNQSLSLSTLFPNMHLELSEVHDDSQFTEIMELHRAAFEDPYSKLWPLLYPEYGEGANARAAALADGVSRTTRLHRNDPNGHWIQVVDLDSKRVVGAARWIFSKRNPFEGTSLAVDSFWWPEGEKREFANICMKQFREPRYTKMQRPHACRFI